MYAHAPMCWCRHLFAASLNKTLHVWEGFQPSSPAKKQTVPISTDIRVEPFDCNIFTPPDLAAAGYKMINSAWTPLYIAANGRDGVHHPVPPEQVYRWNPWLFGTASVPIQLVHCLSNSYTCNNLLVDRFCFSSPHF